MKQPAQNTAEPPLGIKVEDGTTDSVFRRTGLEYTVPHHFEDGRAHMENQDLLDAINQIMPYGKYKGRQLLDIPEPYLVWYHSKGFPQGKLGKQLALIYEVKLNGLEGMLRRFQQ